MAHSNHPPGGEQHDHRDHHALMVSYLALGGVILYFLLRTYSLAEVLGVGSVKALFYGVILMPYYDTIVDEFAMDYENNTLWKKMAPGLLVWIALALGVIVEIVAK